jgi:hypothetical protein
MAIVGVQLADSGLPAISDATYMQVSALLDLAAVMARLRCRCEVSMCYKTPRQYLIAPPASTADLYSAAASNIRLLNVREACPGAAKATA